MSGEPIMAPGLPGDEPGRKGAASPSGVPAFSVLERALKDLVEEQAADDVVVELFPGSHPGRAEHRADGPWFVPGSELDRMPPGPGLAAALDETWAAGLAGLSDEEIAGVILAWRRCESRAAAGLLAAVGELSRRREAGADQQLFDHLDDEVSVLLTLTRPAAQVLVGTAASIMRLPATMGALAAGRIDRYKAEVIAYETALLDADIAAAVEQLVIEDAPGLTSSRLRARLRRAVLAADPDAARRRPQRAEGDPGDRHRRQAGAGSVPRRRAHPVSPICSRSAVISRATSTTTTSCWMQQLNMLHVTCSTVKIWAEGPGCRTVLEGARGCARRGITAGGNCSSRTRRIRCPVKPT